MAFIPIAPLVRNGRRRPRGGFWVPQLRPLYQQCVLPTAAQCATLPDLSQPTHADVAASEPSTWIHTTRRPPPPPAPLASLRVPPVSTVLAAAAARRENGAGGAVLQPGSPGPPAKRRCGADRDPVPVVAETPPSVEEPAHPPSTVQRSYHLHIRPSNAQRWELRRWFECGRWSYNTMVRAINGGVVRPGPNGRIAARRVAAELVAQHRRFLTATWPNVHNCVYRKSMEMAANAYNASAAQHRGTGRTFVLHERTAACLSEVIPVPAAQLQSATKASADRGAVQIVPAPPSPGAVGGARRRAALVMACGLAPKCVGGALGLAGSPRILEELLAHTTPGDARACLPHGGKLQWNHRSNRFYLIVHLARDVPPRRIDERPAAEHRVVALDPGARHFQVWYDPRDGAHGELLAAVGRGDATNDVGSVLDARLDRADRLRRRRRRDRRQPPDDPEAWAAWFARQRGRRADAERARSAALPAEWDWARRHWLRLRYREQRRRRRDALRRAGQWTHDWMRHAHYDAIGFLTDDVNGWDVVVPSTVKFSRLLRCENPHLPGSSRRRLRYWSHYAFGQRLRSVAETRGVLPGAWSVNRKHRPLPVWGVRITGVRDQSYLRGVRRPEPPPGRCASVSVPEPALRDASPPRSQRRTEQPPVCAHHRTHHPPVTPRGGRAGRDQATSLNQRRPPWRGPSERHHGWDWLPKAE